MHTSRFGRTPGVALITALSFACGSPAVSDDVDPPASSSDDKAPSSDTDERPPKPPADGSVDAGHDGGPTGEFTDPGAPDGGAPVDAGYPGDVPPLSLAVGDPISGVGAILGVGNNSVNGECTVGALGIDKDGKKVALTAGHCADNLDAIIVKNGLKEQAQGKKSTKIGRARVYVRSIPLKDTFNKSNVTDVVAVELDYWVDMVPSGLTVGAPTIGDKVFRKGNGFTSPATSKGTVGVVTPNDFGTDMADGASAGDSGGPVMSDDSKILFGIVSRPYKDASDKRIMATRVDAVIAELTKLGGLGAGLVLK